MNIQLNNVSKKFNTNWIFRNINFEFSDKGSYTIVGCNGAGKSTLIQIIAGNIQPTEGNVQYYYNNKLIFAEDIYKYISFCSPYLELIEEFTLQEMLNFHEKIKRFLPNITIAEIIDIAELETIFFKKKIKEYSTGMKQKIKLMITLLSNVPVVLLDEPCNNLDKKNIHWFYQLIKKYSYNRLLLICSNNREEEICLCSCSISIENYK